MKKVGVILVLLFSISLVSFASAFNQSDIDRGFVCLEDQAKDCSSLSNQEIALTILATPDNIFAKCVQKLKDKKTGNNWGNVRDTALAVLALNHAKESTKDAEEWLLNQTKSPTDLEWYIEQDSNSAVNCVFSYSGQDYNVVIGENKKIENDAGTCLTRAQSNFWFKISPSCYDKEFKMECDKDFIGSLLYKSSGSETIHVLEGTQSSPAFGTIKLTVDSKCFGSGSCEYEATAWAVSALLKTGHDVSKFLPYLIARGENNARFLPDAFIYSATSYNDYATKLVSQVKLGNYWLADNSAYNKFYDTALAIISLGGSSAEQVSKSKDWLVFSQGSNGCWQNSVRDTGIVLWALTGKAGKSSGGNGTGTTTYCSDAKYFCIPTADCPSVENVGKNYFCPSLSETCCMSENLKSCSVLGGQVCSSGQVCVGNEKKSLDSNQCCTGECVDRQEESECEANFYTCANSCGDSQEEISLFACDGGQVCCKAKTSDSDGGSLWWLWLLIIILVIAILGWVFRERLQVLWAKLKTKFKKKGGPAPSSQSRPMPPRGPPVPPAPMFSSRPRQVVTANGYRGYDRRDREMSDTFKRLRDLSK